MNRRRFFQQSTVAAITLLAWIKTSLALTEPLPRKLGAFDVLDDGTLSLHGMTQFPIYGMDGGLSLSVISYKLIGKKVIEITEHPTRGVTKRVTKDIN